MGARARAVFLVERYLPLAGETEATAIAVQLERAQDALRRRGREIDWLQSLVVPRDDAWLCLFAASDMRDVHELNQLAGVDSDAILEAQLIRPTGVPPRPG